MVITRRLHRSQQRRRGEALDVDDEVDRGVDQLPRAPLVRRIVVEEEEQDAHVQRPQQRRRRLAHIVGQPLAGERLGKDVDAQLALLARRGTEPRQRDVRDRRRSGRARAGAADRPA